jgi:uncharacterized protein YaaR (DUF327 family)
MQQKDRAFAEWSTLVCTKNNLLAGTGSFLNEMQLKNLLEARMNEALHQMYNTENACAVALFCAWLTKVKELDEKRANLEKEIFRQILRN